MFLDKVIAIFAPESALKRIHARIALEALSARSYEAAKVGRRTDGWTTASTSATHEIQAAGSHIRDRTRDLVRNNPYARKALRILSDNLVGTGIIPQARTLSDKLNKQIMSAWENWISECDVEGDLNLYGIEALVVRSVFESGECFVRCIDTQAESDGGSDVVPIQLQVLEADHLDATKTLELDGSRYIRQGIEFDASGRRVAYWMFKNHPGDGVTGAHAKHSGSIRIPASEILHIFIKERPGQIRGVSSFAASLLRLKDLDDYDDAELWRKKIEACFAAFVIQNSGSEGPTLGSIAVGSGSSRGQTRVENFRPGMIEYLKPGEDVRFGAPTGDASYESYSRVQLHAIAAGLGVTYEQLTGDLSQVNYSSLRAGLLEFRRSIETLRWQMFIPMFCEPIWKRFIVKAFIAGLIGKIDTRVNWTAPKFEMIDPVKDAEADTLMMRNGTLTLREAIANRGFDPDTQIEEIARTNDLLDTHGIVLDSDARLTSKNGMPTRFNEPKTYDDPKQSAPTKTD